MSKIDYDGYLGSVNNVFSLFLFLKSGPVHICMANIYYQPPLSIYIDHSNHGK